MDQELIAQMQEMGDNLEKERKIDHMALFSDGNSATNFVSYLESDGYSIDGKHYAEAEKQYIVQFSKLSTPIKMQQTSLVLLGKISEFSGAYDGWGCPIAE